MKENLPLWGLRPHTPGIFRFRAKMDNAEVKDGTQTVLPFRRPGQRSGRIPALPYPPPGCPQYTSTARFTPGRRTRYKYSVLGRLRWPVLQ